MNANHVGANPLRGAHRCTHLEARRGRSRRRAGRTCIAFGFTERLGVHDLQIHGASGRDAAQAPPRHRLRCDSAQRGNGYGAAQSVDDCVRVHAIWNHTYIGNATMLPSGHAKLAG